MFSFGHCPNYLIPPTSPQFGQLVPPQVGKATGQKSLGPINQPLWPTLSSNWVPFLLLLAKKKKKKNGYPIWLCRMCCTKKSYPSDWDLANWWHSGNIWTKRHQFFVFEFAQREIWHLIDVSSLYWVFSLSKTVFSLWNKLKFILKILSKYALCYS